MKNAEPQLAMLISVNPPITGHALAFRQVSNLQSPVVLVGAHGKSPPVVSFKNRSISVTE
jgi:hypothetical protein